VIRDGGGERRADAADPRPLVVEMIGPAGGGKTTLIRALCASEEGSGIGIEIPYARAALAMFSKVASIGPTWLFHRPRDRWFSWREMKSLTFVDEWSRQLARGCASGSVVFLDHGALHRLASLREFGPSITRTERFERWWDASLRRWYATLDLVVWLDAPDDVLLARVDLRGHWYLSTRRPEPDKLVFLDRYRRALADLVDGAERDGVAVLRLSTDGAAVEDLAVRVREALAGLWARPAHRSEASSR
jgi:hypothetical protein